MFKNKQFNNYIANEINNFRKDVNGGESGIDTSKDLSMS